MRHGHRSLSYGPQRPIGDNKTLYGRAKNRRVEFHILEPASLAVPGSRPTASAAGTGADAAEPPPAPSPAGGPVQAPATPAAPAGPGGPVKISAPAAADAPGEKRGNKHRGNKSKEVKGAAAAPATKGAATPGDEKPKKRHRAHKPK